MQPIFALIITHRNVLEAASLDTILLKSLHASVTDPDFTTQVLLH